MAILRGSRLSSLLGGKGFDPKRVGNCITWLRGDSTDGAGPVAVWHDKVKNLAFPLDTINGTPNLAPNVLNNQAVVNFATADSERISGTANELDGTAMTTFTVAIVLRSTGLTALDIFCTKNTGQGTGFVIRKSAADVWEFSPFAGAGAVASGTKAAVLNQWEIFLCVYDGTTGFVYDRNVLEDSNASAYDVDSDGNLIMGSDGGSLNVEGQIAEAMIFGEALDSGQRQKVVDYLESRYEL